MILIFPRSVAKESGINVIKTTIDCIINNILNKINLFVFANIVRKTNNGKNHLVCVFNNTKIFKNINNVKKIIFLFL